MRHPRRLHYNGPAAERGFGLGWAFHYPAEIDSTRDYVVIRVYAKQPSPTPDGWLGVWITPPRNETAESFEHPDVEPVIRWARSTGVTQIMVEDRKTRTLTVLGPQAGTAEGPVGS